MDVKIKPVDYHLRIHRISNDTYIATFVGNPNATMEGMVNYHKDYDNQGALYYVVAVVLIYGCSIVLMIASLIKKTHADHGLSKYMRDLDTVRRVELRQAKFKTRLAMMQTKKIRTIMNNIGSTPGGAVAKTKAQTVVVEEGGNRGIEVKCEELVFKWDNINNMSDSQPASSSNWSLSSNREGEEIIYPLLSPTLPHMSGSESPSPAPSPADVRALSPTPDVSIQIEEHQDKTPPPPTIIIAHTSSSILEPPSGGDDTLTMIYNASRSLDTLHEEDEEHSSFV